MFQRLRALLSQNRRVTDIERTSAEIRGELERTRTDLEQLEADVAWLGAEIKKLRGRVTGSVRKDRETADNGERVDADAINAAIRAGTFGVQRGRR